MKLIRKILIILLMVMGIFLSIKIDTFATIAQTSLIQEDNMMGGVTFDRYKIKSSNYGASPVERDVFSYTIPHDATKVKLATWTYANPYGYEKKNLMDIARDYEKNHPGYIVLGGVNAEGYFASKGGYSTYEPTNAVVQDGCVIRKDISSEEFKEMICLNQDKTYSIKRVPEVSSKPYLYIYDNNDEVINHLEITGVNTLVDTGLCLLTRDYTGSLDLSSYKVVKGTSTLYRITTSYPDHLMTGYDLGIFVKGSIDTEFTQAINKIKDGEFFLATKNEGLYSKLTPGSEIKIQYDYLDEFGKTESAIGYMFKYLENGVVCDDNYQIYLKEEGRYAAKYGQHDYYKSTYKERVGIGFKDNGDIVLMASNTNTGGPTQYEMGEYFKSFGCSNAYQFDGGGSVTFIKRNSSGDFDMLNTPGDGVARTILCGLFIVMEVADIRVDVKNITDTSVVLDREIISSGGSDVSKIYLKIGNDLYPFNKELTIKNLDRFTTYNYELYDAKYTTLNVTGSFTTLKEEANVSRLKVEKISDGYKYTIQYDDIDKVLYDLHLSVDGRNKNFNEGVAIIKDSNLCALNYLFIETSQKLDGSNNTTIIYTTQDIGKEVNEKIKIEYGIEEVFDCEFNNLGKLLNDFMD